MPYVLTSVNSTPMQMVTPFVSQPTASAFGRSPHPARNLFAPTPPIAPSSPTYHSATPFVPCRLSASQFHFRGDPVRWVAGWRGGRYLNLRLDLPGSFGAKHSLAFAQRPPVAWPDGRRTAVVWLYHDAHGDRNDYFQDTYLNLAISPYIESSRERFDSIALFVNTLHGPERRAFPL